MVAGPGLPEQGSNRGHSPGQPVNGFIAGVWCGAHCIEHPEVTRSDGVIREIFGWKRWQATVPSSAIPGNLTRHFFCDPSDNYLFPVLGDKAPRAFWAPPILFICFMSFLMSSNCFIRLLTS